MAIKLSEYRALQEQLTIATAKIAELEKKLKESENMKDYHYKNYQEAQSMLEQVHQVLDAVPGAIARESEGENSWDRVKRSPVTRLAAWLAIR